MLPKRNFIQKIKTVAHRWMPQAEVFLFGSRARGTAKPTSDWDLLILLNTNTVLYDTETQLMDIFYDLKLETGQVISPLIYTKEQWFQKRVNTPLFHTIEKKGVRLQWQAINYDDLFDFDEEKVVPYFKPARDLIQIIDDLLG